MEKVGAQVLFSGKGKVNIKNLFQVLERLDFKKILVEGGGEINWSVLKLGLADELIVTISPVVIGGRDAKTLVEGEGIANITNGIKMKLSKTVIQNKNELGCTTNYDVISSFELMSNKICSILRLEHP